MIQGYPAQPSVIPGETLTFHVSTDAPQFRVDFYRQGQTLVFKQSSGWLTSAATPAGGKSHSMMRSLFAGCITGQTLRYPTTRKTPSLA